MLRPFAPFLLLATLLLVAGSAHAAEAQASIAPARAAPGERVEATLVVDGDLIEAGVMETVTCVLRSASGDEPCASETFLVEARVMPGRHAYAFAFDAPADAGEYVVLIERQGLLGLLGPSVSGEAPLVVDATLQPATDPAGGGGGDDGARPAGPGPSTEALPPGAGPGEGDGPGGSGSGGPGTDASRFALSTMLGSAALVAGLVLTRRGGL